MGYHSLLEISHDVARPDEPEWAKALAWYVSSGDRKLLPPGVTYLRRRHSSEPGPKQRPQVSPEQIALVEKELRRVRREAHEHEREKQFTSATLTASIANLEGILSLLRLLRATDAEPERELSDA